MNMQSLNGDSYQGSQVGANVQSQVGEMPPAGPFWQGRVWAKKFHLTLALLTGLGLAAEWRLRISGCGLFLPRH